MASLAIVLWLLVLQVEAVSPGPLAFVHEREPDLLGSRGCAQCHGEGATGMAGACSECHEPIRAEIHGARGLHGTLVDVDARDCARCHGEHSGADFPLVSQRSFQMAGFASREAYDHGALDFLLQGRHVELGCDECHVNADVLLLPPGQARFAGLDQGCQNCHEDSHEGRIVRACAECHGQEHPFAFVATFAHSSFESECAHSAVSCQECHPKDGAHDSERLAGPEPTSCVRACQVCHDSPHSEPFNVAADALAGFAPGQGCAGCHSESHGGFAGHPEASSPILHAASGFALDAPHNQVTCDDCHLEIAGDEVGFWRHEPARAQDDCRACHDDPHLGQFEAGPFGLQGCLVCHVRETFVPSTIGLPEHSLTDFPLVQSHEAVACERCHAEPVREEPRRYEGTSTLCSDCHSDAHRGAFDDFDNTEGCARCHEPTLFSEVLDERFEHGEWTNFELDGAHQRADCTVCHRRQAPADEHGRTFGQAAQVFGTSIEGCDSCHADVHEGRFDEPGLPQAIAEREGCARCHTTEAFEDLHDASFEHERWTGYPMAPFHAALECTECHVPGAVPNELGRRFGRALTRCQDCHVDPHVGQFTLEGVTDCARCHEDAGPLAFDHQRDSRFTLDELHATVECSACHVPWPLPDGSTPVRYKPLGTECVDCHDSDFLERSERQVPRRKRREGGFDPRGGPR